MTTDVRIARRKLSLLELAQELGNVSKACKIVGYSRQQFYEIRRMTAHNSYLLSLAELGIVGLILFLTIIFLCFKTLIVGMRELADVPGTRAANVWGMALLAALAGIVFQINTLSFLYHPVLWIFFGLVGAWCSAIRHHRPEFQVKLNTRDMIIVVSVCAVYVFGFLPMREVYGRADRVIVNFKEWGRIGTALAP